MILFAASRSEALKRFLVDDGSGPRPTFLAVSPKPSPLSTHRTREEKRWVDGVLARKKGLGL